MQTYPQRPTWILVTLLIALSGWGSTACDSNSGGTPALRQESGAEHTSAGPEADSIRWRAVDQALGRKGETQPGGVHKYGMPRSDLAVTSQAIRIKPALALGSWLAFKPKGTGAVAMGDLVLTEREYASVIARLQESGIAQTAMHKHLLEHSPALWWTHVHAEGHPAKIAGAVKAALELTGTPPPQTPRGSSEPLELDTLGISRALGHTGTVNGGVYQVSVPRGETIRAHGIEVPPSMGTATALNFQPTGGGKAAISGDFVMVADEVQPVIAALQATGIQLVALHNHMLDEEPRLFFMHFWAQDNAVKLAGGLKAALDKTNSARQ